MTTTTFRRPEAPSDEGSLLTISEAAKLLRISRSHGYELAKRYLLTDGAEGIPAIQVGSCVRVPAWALREMVRTGRIVQLAAIPTYAPNDPRNG